MSEKRHIYLLDTNILMNYPTAVYGFDDNEIVITATTIEELDSLKQGKTERACQAREVFRQSLTPLRQKALRSHADLASGVKINRDRCDPKHTLLARFRDGMFRRLYTLSDSCRVAPRNISQHFAIDALMAPPEEIPLVILQGEAGTAKTFLTVACGMDQMVDRRFPMPEIRFSFLPLCGKMGKKMHGGREGRRCSER